MRWLWMVPAALVLAGCSGSNDDDKGIPPTYTVVVAGLPQRAEVGEPVLISVVASGDATHTSDHVGAHFWNASKPDPAAAFAQSAACAHPAGNHAVPGSLQVICTFSTVGTLYLRGHVRVSVDGKAHDSFSEEYSIHVVPGPDAYQVTTNDVPQEARVDEAAVFPVRVGGPLGSTDHVGAHYWASAESAQALNMTAAASCAHAAGNLPGLFTTSCAFSKPGTFHVRGHVRVTVDGEAFNYFGEPFVLNVQ